MSAPFTKPEDMSRDELVQGYKEMMAAGMRLQNHPSLQNCPFCLGTTVVPLIKIQVKESIIHEWHRDVTHDEWYAYWLANYGPPNPAQA